jgi:hypothetical protein
MALKILSRSRLAGPPKPATDTGEKEGIGEIDQGYITYLSASAKKIRFA